MLGMDAEATFIVGTGRDVVILAPASLAMRLATGLTCVASADDSATTVHDDGAIVPAKASALVGELQCHFEKMHRLVFA